MAQAPPVVCGVKQGPGPPPVTGNTDRLCNDGDDWDTPGDGDDGDAPGDGGEKERCSAQRRSRQEEDGGRDQQQLVCCCCCCCCCGITKLHNTTEQQTHLLIIWTTGKLHHIQHIHIISEF